VKGTVPPPDPSEATKGYWESTYKDEPRPVPLDPHRTGLRYRAKRAQHAFFKETFSGVETKGLSLLECGCGGSVFLPYFAKEFEFRISGIDYSEAGCELARRTLHEAGVEGEIVCADFRTPPKLLLDRFDVIVSFGVAEHFTEPSTCLAAFATMLRPGGLLITWVPNMAGLVGDLQRLLSRGVFEKHVVLDAGSLQAAHVRAGLEIQRAGYLTFVNFGVVNLNEIPRGTVEYGAKRLALGALQVLTGVIWLLEEFVGPFPTNKYTSPYAFCTAVRPQSFGSLTS
jgi:2-polyprenyl-3-methyl-5-hydroxy-6-metoxy-1,4-benzoquinol methylase